MSTPTGILATALDTLSAVVSRESQGVRCHLPRGETVDLTLFVSVQDQLEWWSRNRMAYDLDADGARCHRVDFYEPGWIVGGRIAGKPVLTISSHRVELYRLPSLHPQLTWAPYYWTSDIIDDLITRLSASCIRFVTTHRDRRFYFYTVEPRRFFEKA